ncbi:MAG: hypothetical protein D6705_10275, partial [Deltaproteobacteria bacterium]
GETVVRDGTLVAGRRTRLSVDLERTDASDVQPLDLEVFVEAAGPSGEVVSGPHPVWLESGEDVARFDVWVDGEAIVAEGAVSVRVREPQGAASPDGPRARWSARIPEDLDVREVAALDLVIVPIRHAYYDGCAPWDPDRVDFDAWSERLIQVLPVADVRWQVDAPLVWPHPVESFNDQKAVAATVAAMAEAAPEPGRVIVGVARRCATCDGTCAGGLAGVGSLPLGIAAVYLEVRETDAVPDVADHEIGHTAGLLHAPCPAGVGGADPDYPVPDGRIDVPGLGIFDEIERDPAETYDMMGGCWPRWISRYNWLRLVDVFSVGTPSDEAPPLAPARTGGRVAVVAWDHVPARAGP